MILLGGREVEPRGHGLGLLAHQRPSNIMTPNITYALLTITYNFLNTFLVCDVISAMPGYFGVTCCVTHYGLGVRGWMYSRLKMFLPSNKT